MAAVVPPESGCECHHAVNSSWVKSACWTAEGVGPGLGMTVGYKSGFVCFYPGVSYARFFAFVHAASVGHAVYEMGFYDAPYQHPVAPFNCEGIGIG